MKSLRVTKPEQYEMLYEALLSKREGYSIKQARTIGKVFDKMEAIGKVKETVQGIDFYTCEVPCQFDLEDAEFQEAKVIYEGMTWTGRGIRKAVQVADWLDEMEKDAKGPAKLQKV